MFGVAVLLRGHLAFQLRQAIEQFALARGLFLLVRHPLAVGHELAHPIGEAGAVDRDLGDHPDADRAALEKGFFLQHPSACDSRGDADDVVAHQLHVLHFADGLEPGARFLESVALRLGDRRGTGVVLTLRRADDLADFLAE